jgi:hypothetical protein
MLFPYNTWVGVCVYVCLFSRKIIKKDFKIFCLYVSHLASVFFLSRFFNAYGNGIRSTRTVSF